MRSRRWSSSLRKHKEKVQDRHRGTGHRPGGELGRLLRCRGMPVSREIPCMKFADFIMSPRRFAPIWPPTTRKGPSAKWSRLWPGRRGGGRREFESIVKAILKREELGSTGIGRGVAVPHTKHPSVDRLVGTVAVSQRGRRFRQPRRRDRPPVLPADFAARSAGRSPAAGEHLAPTPRRHVLPFLKQARPPRTSAIARRGQQPVRTARPMSAVQTHRGRHRRACTLAVPSGSTPAEAGVMKS